MAAARPLCTSCLNVRRDPRPPTHHHHLVAACGLRESLTRCNRAAAPVYPHSVQAGRRHAKLTMPVWQSAGGRVEFRASHLPKSRVIATDARPIICQGAESQQLILQKEQSQRYLIQGESSAKEQSHRNSCGWASGDVASPRSLGWVHPCDALLELVDEFAVHASWQAFQWACAIP